MTEKFGWCMGPEGATEDHDTCPYEIGTSNGILRCTCPHHKAKEAN